MPTPAWYPITEMKLSTVFFLFFIVQLAFADPQKDAPATTEKEGIVGGVAANVEAAGVPSAAGGENGEACNSTEKANDGAVHTKI